MDLKDFIKESLVQISNGIIEANIELKNTKASVNPIGIVPFSQSSQAFAHVVESTEINSLVEIIEFDVAVQAESGTQTGGGLKVSIMSISAGVDGKTSDTHTSESRIRFKIPMVYPHGGTL